jgi:hypothetical protein
LYLISAFKYIFLPMSAAAYVFPVKRTPLSVARLLTIDPLYLEFEGPLANISFTKDDMEGYRFGISGFRYLLIPINRTYNIEVRSSMGKIILIRMHSFFGIGNKKIGKLFVQIRNKIHQAYFTDMSIHYANLLNSGLTYELAGATLTSEGVLLRQENQIIPWIRVGLKHYYQYCSIYDLADPQHMRSFDFWHDWNASLIYTVVEYKLRDDASRLYK